MSVPVRSFVQWLIWNDLDTLQWILQFLCQAGRDWPFEAAGAKGFMAVKHATSVLSAHDT